MFEPHENWIQLLDGAAYSFTSGRFSKAPSVNVIARALSHLPRYTGHTGRPYSVAQHSVLVCDLIGNDVEAKMYGLVHDAHEALIGDVSSPLKKELAGLGAGHALHWLEEQANKALFPLFGLQYPMPLRVRETVKRADMIALATERESLFPSSSTDWRLPYAPAPGVKVEPWHAPHAEHTWLKCYQLLRWALGAGREAMARETKTVAP